MPPKNRNHAKEEPKLHPRNKHRGEYDFKSLVLSYPKLAAFIKPNKYGNQSIDFFDSEAVLALNTALLKHDYQIEYWHIPKGYLCPPIPSRADYIHHIATLLSQTNKKNQTIPHNIKCLDIGVGANCIYPIIGHQIYNWSFVGSDIDPVAIASANKIIKSNGLQESIKVKLQPNQKDLFRGVVSKGERFDLSICNPPFHASKSVADKGTIRKLTNLKKQKITTPSLNFGGKSNELYCEGGEDIFIRNMIYQSKHFAKSILWFSTLVSKKSNLKSIYKTLKRVKAVTVKTIAMRQGNKVSRIVAWTFLNDIEQEEWFDTTK